MAGLAGKCILLILVGVILVGADRLQPTTNFSKDRPVSL
jgi:hypothetical protein